MITRFMELRAPTTLRDNLNNSPGESTWAVPGPKHLGTGAACNGTLHDVVSKAVLKIPWVFFWGGHQKKDV